MPAGAPANDPDLLRWAQALVAAQEVDSCLQLKGDFSGLPLPLCLSIWIKPDYPRLADAILDKPIPLASVIPFLVGRGELITGDPGIGKSAFAVYFIKRLVVRRCVVFYQCKHLGDKICLKFDFPDHAALKA
eukprot:GHUV01044339.1.p1 GENE.GHUV01044339.1~~GHUV01044339.1.p1  ORF type:complete len:132 (+),score=17.57 GHUV01044339.1:518-913(+)